MKRLNQIHKGVVLFIGIIFSFLAVIIFLLNIEFSANVPISEHVEFRYAGVAWLPAAVIILAICFVIYRFQDKIDEKKLFAFFAVLYILAGVCIILSIEPVLRADAKSIYTTLKSFLLGNYSSMDVGGYMYRYPQQFGLLAYEGLMSLVSTDVRWFFICNILEAVVTNYFIYKVTDLMFGHQHIYNILVITLSFLFLPQLFFITFVYGLIPGFCCMMTGVYCCLLFHKNKKYRFMVLASLFMAFSALLKSNYLIGMMAVIIYELIIFIKCREKECMFIVFGVLAAFFVTNGLLHYSVEKTSGKQINEGTPTVLWIAMGTDPENSKRAPGWYNSYNYRTYEGSGFDEAAAAVLGKEKVKENINYFIENPGEIIHFFGKKIVSMWCEPTFQAIWSGPLEAYGQKTRTDFAASVYDQGKAYLILYGFMKADSMLLLLAVVVSIIKQQKNREMLLFELYFIGGFIFHLFWEGKSQYVYTYLFVLIPAAALGIKSICDTLSGSIQRRHS